MRKAIKLSDPDIVVTVECLPTTMPIEGNAIADGNPLTVRHEEARIRRDLKGGNSWAWCSIRVAVTYRGVINAVALADGQTFRSEREFKEDDLYQDMRAEALVELNKKIAVICGAKGA